AAKPSNFLAVVPAIMIWGETRGPRRLTERKRTATMRRLAFVALLLAPAGCGTKEPLYKDKPAGYWRLGLKNTTAEERREAAGALAALKAKDAVPDLIASLQDKDDAVRAGAAEALWSVGPEAREAVPALVPLLRDKSPAVRLNAAGALGDIG